VIGVNTLRISHRHKFIFFSNPRTGSESVRLFLDPITDVFSVEIPKITEKHPYYHHIRPIEVHNHFNKIGLNFLEYYRFTFVRNPWKRLVSTYFRIKKFIPNFHSSFEEWLLNTSPGEDGGKGHDLQRWRKYGTYSIDNFAGDHVSEVFRLEDIDSLPKKLYEKGIPVDPYSKVPFINKKDIDIDYKELYTQKTIDFVYEKYYNDIIKYGYNFQKDLENKPL
jgi:hypothetical protein